MYSIQNRPKVLLSKKSIDQTTSLGLGLSILQLGFGLYKYAQVGFNDDNESHPLDGNYKSQVNGTLMNCGSSTKDEELHKNPTAELPCSKVHLPIHQHELGKCLVIGVILYAQLFLVIVDAYLYRFLFRATQKENLYNCWLGLYLQISLLTYNVAEILIVAHNGVFDGSSMLLAARATVRSLSIEMIYLFLREIEDKQETDVFLYIILNV